jgi:3-methyladenine DNA glycosylase AlkD
MKGRSQSLSIPTKRSRSKPGKAQAAQEWTIRRALDELVRHGEKRNVEGMEYFAIRTKKVYGVSTPKLHRIARVIGKNHSLGLQLWKTGIYDARILGAMISEARRVTPRQMESWVRCFDNWAVCDGTCCHLFAYAKPAWKKAFSWSSREKEFEKRAGFALAAYLAVHDKTAKDEPFVRFLKVIEREAWDERNFVKKAVNWALRSIGKRNARLNRAAIKAAEKIQRGGTRAGRWIAADALRELKSEAVQKRLSQVEG